MSEVRRVVIDNREYQLSGNLTEAALMVMILSWKAMEKEEQHNINVNTTSEHNG